MKLFFDFFPIILFFFAYKFGDIYLATLTAIIASLVQVIVSRIKHGYFEKMPLLTLVIITVMGGATLIFRNELFIKWKPTALYWLLSVSFLISQFIGEKPLIQRAAEKGIQLNSEIWYRLNLSWVLFFALMGGVNLYVVYSYDTDTWVNFKLFGSLGLTLVFVVLQTIYMVKHAKRVSQDKEPLRQESLGSKKH